MNAHARDVLAALPDAMEAEQALLGSILVQNASFWTVAGFLKPMHFSEPLHQVIYETSGTMISEGRAANPITMKPYLPADGRIGDLSVWEYLVRLVADAVTTSGAYDYGRAIMEIWARRQLIGVAQDLDKLARHMPIDMSPEKIIGEMNGKASAILQEITDASKSVTMADAIGEAVKAIDDAYNFHRPAGISTGIDSVDRLTGPWEPGQQIIVGGGTKQGKSALAMQCAIGLSAHGMVWVYSGEMSVKQLAMREIARRTGIPVWRQKEGRLSNADLARIKGIRSQVETLPIIIEKRRLTLDQIHATCRELKAHKGLAAVVIDHCGLLAWPREMVRKDEWELSQHATMRLKEIYEDLRVPGMSLVQLKKNTFAQDWRGRSSFADKLKEAITRRPKYTDLMGAVERDADHVLIPFNARPIIAGLEPQEGSDDYLVWEDRMKEHECKAEIILALSREKQFPARESVEWNGETTSFGPAFVGRQESLLPEGY